MQRFGAPSGYPLGSAAVVKAPRGNRRIWEPAAQAGPSNWQSSLPPVANEQGYTNAHNDYQSHKDTMLNRARATYGQVAPDVGFILTLQQRHSGESGRHGYTIVGVSLTIWNSPAL